MNKHYWFVIIGLLVIGCTEKQTTTLSKEAFTSLKFSENILNYNLSPQNKFDKSGLMFSDQGAWFAYSFPTDSIDELGFSGPFLMTQQNGVWSSSMLTNLMVENTQWGSHSAKSYNSHLEQQFYSKNIELKQTLFFHSGHTALIQSTFKNRTDKEIVIDYHFKNKPLLADGLHLRVIAKNEVAISSSKTNAIGYLIFPKETEITSTDTLYTTKSQTLKIAPNQTESITVSQSFIFPEYSWKDEKKQLTILNFDSIIQKRKQEKELQLKRLMDHRKSKFKQDKYAEVIAKAHLTLQNNWRIAAGEIKHEGLFPSYHYEWFNGFWSWDSWKHAVGLSNYDTNLAKNQMRAMFDFQNEDGFIVDCVYRDTTIEAHNYRDTKPPLSAWAIVKIFEKDNDSAFVKEFYPKLKKYHSWWYAKRDHDQDGLCEYGSTDGTLIAAKWESGMDNAIRFDSSKILKNGNDAYSLDQESVDLNAYLYAEKLFLAFLAEILQKNDEALIFKENAERLKQKIQDQFYDNNDGWFYDTNLDGDAFIKGEGSEGWIALWAKAATQEQAHAVKDKMMNPVKFYTKVPFQTMSANHPKFDPLNGYWRGPNWLDQAYFGVKGLRNYGFNIEADTATNQIFDGAEGLLGKGQSIRENYHPLTGKGLHAQNFSWSAAHILMLLLNE